MPVPTEDRRRPLLVPDGVEVAVHELGQRLKLNQKLTKEISDSTRELLREMRENERVLNRLNLGTQSSNSADPLIQKQLERLRSDDSVELNTIVDEYRKELTAENQSTFDDLMMMRNERDSTAKDLSKDPNWWRSGKQALNCRSSDIFKKTCSGVSIKINI
jgi:DNA anti-recombination protein RmuC